MAPENDIPANGIPLAPPEAYASDILGAMIVWGLNRRTAHTIALIMAQNCAGISDETFLEKYAPKIENAIDKGI